MHILYHAPFALNSFNVVFFSLLLTRYLCSPFFALTQLGVYIQCVFFFFRALSFVVSILFSYLLQFSLFIYRLHWILNTEYLFFFVVALRTALFSCVDFCIKLISFPFSFLLPPPLSPQPLSLPPFFCLLSFVFSQ